MPTLEWIGKSKVINHDKEVPFKVLNAQYTFDADGEHKGVADSDNMIIHGDNLLALKALLPKYKGQVKCIYIDPPYNTGNEGWIYNDNVNDPQMKKWLGEVVGKEGEDLSRHDKWLCMMYPRLKLLHELLSEDGVIFISIDDNEQANLKLLCDEIFGSRNFVAEFPKKGTGGRQDSKLFAVIHEYVMCYAKNKNNYIAGRDKKVSGEYPLFDEEKAKKYKLQLLRKWGDNSKKEDRPNLYYPIYFNKKLKRIYLEKQDEEDVEIYPFIEDAICGRWRWKPETMQKNINNGLVEVVIRNGNLIPYEKVYESDDESTKPFNTWINDIGNNGIVILKKILGNNVDFSYPKSIDLIDLIVRMAGSDKNIIILDSFAGSGTTAHAVLKMNKEDGGNRKFICVEMMDYAETVTAERIKRVIKGYGEGKNAVEGTGGSFTYYELGADLFDADGNLNSTVGIDKTRQYIWFMETQQPLAAAEDAGSFLGVYHDTAYYFNYDSSAATVLDYKFLQTIQTRASAYVIYADSCLLSEDELAKYNITFKKIPRDIERL